MFWFAGLIGMGLESKRVRRWLAASAATSLGLADRARISEPISYRSSFNPFPALVIGVTGAAMSAHAQTYLFQVNLKLVPANPDLICFQPGSDTQTVGMAPFGILGSKMPHLLFCLARPTSFNPSLSSADGSARKLFPHMWWSDVHTQHRRSNHCCYATRTRWHAVFFSVVPPYTDK